MQEQWHSLYQNPKYRKMLFPSSPAKVGMYLLKYLENQNVPLYGNVLDIGCGNGRNAITMAKLGYTVYGFDGLTDAVDDARSVAGDLGLSDRTDFICTDVGNIWPYADHFFQLAIDSNTFSSLSVEERIMYLDEIYRVLAPGAIFFLYTYSIRDQYYAQFLPTGRQLSVGKKITCTDDGVERILYTAGELRVLFNHFEISQEYEVSRYGKMFDVYYKRHFIVQILTKK